MSKVDTMHMHTIVEKTNILIRSNCVAQADMHYVQNLMYYQMHAIKKYKKLLVHSDYCCSGGQINEMNRALGHLCAHIG